MLDCIEVRRLMVLAALAWLLALAGVLDSSLAFGWASFPRLVTLPADLDLFLLCAHCIVTRTGGWQ